MNGHSFVPAAQRYSVTLKRESGDVEASYGTGSLETACRAAKRDLEAMPDGTATVHGAPQLIRYKLVAGKAELQS